MNNLLLINFIAYFGLIIFFIIPFRQYYNKYFFYFLVLGLASPIPVIIYHITGMAPFRFSLPFIIMAPAALIFYEPKKYILQIVIFSILLSILSPFIDRDTNTYIKLAGHFTSFMILTMRFSSRFFKKNILNIFLLMLVCYELLTVLKTIQHVYFSEVTIINFYIASSFQILMGIFFIVFKADSPKLSFKVSRLN